MEDGYGGDAVPEGPQAIVTPQSDLKVDFCRVANGRRPWRLKAQIERERRKRKEKTAKKQAENGKCFQFPCDTQNEHQ